MLRIFSISIAVILLTIATVLPGCGGTSSIAEKKASIVSEVFGQTIQTFQTVPVDDAAGGQATVRPSVNRVTDTAGALLGYTVQMQFVSRSGPFTIVVVTGPEFCVKRAEVLAYGAKRGRDVRLPEFTKQFADKCPKDPIRLGRDIDAITGATLSSRAMTDGVRKALLILKSTAASPNQ